MDKDPEPEEADGVMAMSAKPRVQSRAEARASGAIKYWPDKLCKRQHSSPFYTSTGSGCACVAEDTAAMSAKSRLFAEAVYQLQILENRMRNAANRQRMMLLKSRRRDTRATDCDGYMLVDENNRVVAGGSPNAYSLSIQEVATFLTGV